MRVQTRDWFTLFMRTPSNNQLNINCNNTCTCTVPPRWIVEPSDVSVERNRQIALHCQAQGVPTPTIIWKKTTGERHTKAVYTLIYTRHATHSIASLLYCIRTNDRLEKKSRRIHLF